MAQRVALEIRGRVPAVDFVSMLAELGAQELQIDRRSGDAGDGVDSYFFIEFTDAGRRRTAFGFNALASSENEDGWTRLELGADDRGRILLEEVAHRTGAWMIDERSGWSARFERDEPVFQLAACAP